MSSSLIQVTVVPVFTVTRCVAKVKLSILTSRSQPVPRCRRNQDRRGRDGGHKRSCGAHAANGRRDLESRVQACNGWSMIAQFVVAALHWSGRGRGGSLARGSRREGSGTWCRRKRRRRGLVTVTSFPTLPFPNHSDQDRHRPGRAAFA
jgi:hypothetical protein